MAFGPVGAYPEWLKGFAFGIASLLLASSIIPLRCGLRSNPIPETSRVLGFLIFAAAMAALAVAIAWDRVGWVPRPTDGRLYD